MKLKTKFLYVLFFLAIGIGCVSYYVSILNIRTLTQKQVVTYADETQKKFENLRAQDIQMLSLGAYFFTANQEIKDAFLTGDRDLLYQKMQPFFAEARGTYGVTHFNFITPNEKIFLRLQDPQTFDDHIQRQSFLRSVVSHKTENSLELGKNSFALRIVTPYYDGDTLIGYIELGREITNFLETLAYETSDDFAIYGKKSHLDHDDFIASAERKGQPDTWDDRPNYVLLAETKTHDSATTLCVSGIEIDTLVQDRSLYREITADEKKFLCAGFPIKNENDETIATVIVAHDITPMLITNRNAFMIELATIAIVFAVFIIIFYILLHRFVLRPVKELKRTSALVASGDFSQKITYTSKDEIGELATFFNIMTQRLDESTQETTRALKETERSRSLSDALAHDLEKFKRAADSTSDFIIITDIFGKMVYANTAAENISGLSHDDIFSLPDAATHFWGGQTDKQKYDDIWRTIKTKKEPFVGNIKNKTIFGKEYHVALSIAPIFDEFHNIIFFVGIGKDITREKEMEIAKDTFVSLVSHQLRTPLTSIKWLIELLREQKTGDLNAKQKKFLDEAYASTNRLALLVSDILSINRIEMGRVTVKKTPSKITDLLTDIFHEMEVHYKSKDIIVTTHYAEHLPLVDMDPILIRQVIVNIFSNAIKYTPEKGLISFTVEEIPDRIRVTITDTGIGIPPQEQGRIFERFYRASNVQAQYSEGTGLGLFIAKTIIDMCDGTIGFYSQLQHGTTVWFTLPIKNEKRD
ncbi:MAG: ATP-binding protein [Parcubacteria group bacterium]|jgi:two-component system sensor histidine kinase VicK